MIFDVSDLKLIEAINPASAATSTTIEDPTKGVEANNYNEMECCILLSDPGTGAKQVAFTVYTGGEAEIDDADHTLWTSVYTETIVLGTAAYAGIVSITLDQKKFAKKYASFKAIVTHVDPTASKLVTIAGFYLLHGDHRDN